MPTAGRFGTCGANSLTGPGLINLDLGVDRRWLFGERFELKFRAEASNAANTPHHANPTGNPTNGITMSSVNNSNFMQATAIRNTGRDGLDERTFRLGLKFSW